MMLMTMSVHMRRRVRQCRDGDQQANLRALLDPEQRLLGPAGREADVAVPRALRRGGSVDVKTPVECT